MLRFTRSRKTTLAALTALVTAASLTGQSARGEMPPGGALAILPEPVTEANFDALQANSPFIRSIGLSQSLVLTGVARIEEEVYATLFDLETKESFVVTEETNSLGWQLMAVDGNRSDLKTLTARIKVAGSEVVSIRYEEIPKGTRRKVGGPSGSGGSGGLTSEQASEAKLAAVNFREGYSSDGYPRQPPPEIVAKLSRMTVDQREAINRQMIEMRNRGMGMEERRGIYERMVDRSLQGSR